MFTHLKLCLAIAIHNFKWVKICKIKPSGIAMCESTFLVHGTYSLNIDIDKYCHDIQIYCPALKAEMKNTIYCYIVAKIINIMKIMNIHRLIVTYVNVIWLFLDTLWIIILIYFFIVTLSLRNSFRKILNDTNTKYSHLAGLWRARDDPHQKNSISKCHRSVFGTDNQRLPRRSPRWSCTADLMAVTLWTRPIYSEQYQRKPPSRCSRFSVPPFSIPGGTSKTVSRWN